MAGAEVGGLGNKDPQSSLADNIIQLQKALHYWQTWDAEYEALKEEIDALPRSPETELSELHRIRAGYEGELLKGKELQDVFGLDSPRSRDHIINLLQRRIDYVTKNIESLESQIRLAQAEDADESAPPYEEDDEPFTEIIENLDQDDNVISYRLDKPATAISHVRKALARTGLHDPPDSIKVTDKHDTESSTTVSQPPPQTSSSSAPALPTEAATQPSDPVRQPEDLDTVDISDKAGNTYETDTPPVMSRKAERIRRIMETAKEQESISQQEPIIPEDEDEYDAALRQEMIKYCMGEVGSVVAELRLEEGDADEDEEFDDDYNDTDDEEDDAEDQYGRSTSRIVSDKYRQRMLELEERLGVESRFTVNANGARADESDADSDASDHRIGRILVKNSQETSSSSSKPPPAKSNIKDGQKQSRPKKGVRFAQSLDVAPDLEGSITPSVPPSGESGGAPVDPLGDVVERSAPAKASPPAQGSSVSPKTSRFAKARHRPASNGTMPKGPADVPRRFLDQEGQEEPPSGPEGRTLAARLVERDTRSNPRAPDDLEASLDYDAVASEHQALRKRFIQRQGGFLKEDPSPVQYLRGDEEVSEYVSRFKAARLSRQ